MAEQSYTNRELDAKFDNLLEHMRGFEAHTEENFSLVIAQTTKTNGRVRWTEKMIWLAIGGLGVLSIVVLPLVWSLIDSGKF